MTRPILALLLGATLAATLPAQELPRGDNLLAIYPLRGFLVELPRYRPLPFASLLNVRSGFEFSDERHLLFEVDQVLSLLHQVSPLTEQLEIQTMENQLLLSGPAGDIRDAVELLRELEASLTRGIEIRAMVIEHDGGLTPPSVLDAAQLRGVLEGHAHEWSGVARTWSGVPAHLGSHRARAYVFGAHGEVSEGSSEILPVMQELFEGVALRVQPHLLCDSTDLAVTVDFTRGKLLEMAPRDLQLEDVPAIDVPTLQVSCGRFSARIPNAGALVFNSIGGPRDGGNLLVAVSASYRAPESDLPADFRSLPVSALTASGQAFPGQEVAQEAYRIATSLPEFEEEEWVEPIVDDGMLQDLIRSHVDPDTWDDVSLMQYARGRLYLTAEEDRLRRSAGIVNGLQDLWLKTTVMEIELGGTDNEPNRVTFPVLPGCRHGFRRGVETTRVDGTYTEIAKQSHVQLPNIVQLFHGTTARGQTGPGGLEAAARLSLRQSRIDWDGGGLRLLPPVAHADVFHDGHVAEDKATKIGTGLGGDLVLILRHLPAAPTARREEPR